MFVDIQGQRSGIGSKLVHETNGPLAASGEGPTQIKEKKVKARSPEAMRPVHCQLFSPVVTGHGTLKSGLQSKSKEGAVAEEVSSTQQERWMQLRRKVIAARTAIENKARFIGEEGEVDEVSPHE
ncbi:hypothetical protein MMC16_006533 [Acarospora aff. strigata]|nr:hypothetical protein [Acarospora aff. strigata]